VIRPNVHNLDFSSHKPVQTRLEFVVVCCRDELVDSHYADTVMLTAVPKTCTVPILWERRTGAGWVLAERMHNGLGIIGPKRKWKQARMQLLKGRSARVCTAAEQQLLRNHPDIDPSQADFVVAGLDAAIRSLRNVGEPTAAQELCQLQRSHEQLNAPDDAPEHPRAPAGTGSRSEGSGPPAVPSEADDNVVGCSREGLRRGCAIRLALLPLAQ